MWRQLRPSDSPDEASGVKDSSRIERGLEAAHEGERAVVWCVEKLQLVAESWAGCDHAQIAARRMCSFAPSRDRVARRLGGDFIDKEDLRDSDSDVRAKFCVACVEGYGETRRRNCDLRGKRLGVKIDVAEKLVLSERIFVVENLVIRAYQLADFVGLVIDLGRTS
jgi:hypothetical protein